MNNIINIIKPYFDWLTETFGHMAEEAERNNVDAGTVARDYLSNKERRNRFINNGVPNIKNNVFGFWKANAVQINKEIKKIPGLKARFGGDLGPQPEDNIFHRAGLYFETIIVPDPLLRIVRFPAVIQKNIDYYLLKYGINQVLTKDVYFADIFPPLAILVPDYELTKTNVDYENISQIAGFDLIALTNELYGCNLDTIDNTKAFYSKFLSSREAIKQIKKPHLFKISEDADDNIDAQFDTLIEEFKKFVDWRRQEINPDKGEFIGFSLHLRLMQANHNLEQAQQQNALPLIGAPISFHWLLLKLRINQALLSKHLCPDNILDLTLTNSLLSKKLKWLSNITVEDLLKLRKKGALSDIREVIKSETSNLGKISLNDIKNIENQIDLNIYNALQKHQAEIFELEKRYRSELKSSSATFLIAVAAALSPLILSITPTLVSSIGGLLGFSSLKDVVNAIVKYYKEKEIISSTPMGILWQARQKEK